ncbi:MAG: hypothetical protein JNL33_12185 [Betaproteobacteria bacterium]|nr:hypothetical protein [Betaproteobacteria bacterium]
MRCLEKINREIYLNIVAWGILALSFGTILHFLGDYQVVWAHPENLVKREAMLAWTGSGGPGIRDMFNWPVWEAGAPRMTRLLSSAGELVDTRLRGWFAEFALPHPSLSIAWIFALTLAPWFLYRTLRSLGRPSWQSLLGTALFVSSPAVLSLVAMGFRPGKAMALCFINALAYLTVRLHVTLSPHSSRWAVTRAYLVICLVLLVSLFTDEIAFFSLFVIACLCPWNRSRMAFALPILAAGVALSYLWIATTVLPALHAMAGFPVTCFHHCSNGRYNLLDKALSIFTLDQTASGYAELGTAVMVDAGLALRDLSGLALMWAPGWGLLKFLGIATLAALTVALYLRLRQGTRSGQVNAGQTGPVSRWAWRATLLFASALLFHGGLMWITPHPIWGVYWYGVFTGLPFVLLVTTMLGTHRGPLPALLLGMGMLITANFANFVSTNYAYKDYHYYPRRARTLSDIFLMKTNKFALTDARSARYNLRELTRDFLRLGKNLDRIELPFELEYLLQETRVCPWEFDYYDRVARNDGVVTIMCFSTRLPALAAGLAAARADPAGRTPGQMRVWVGLYDEGGYADLRRKAYIALSDEGTLYVVNGAGDRAAATDKGDTLEVPAWKLSGRYDKSTESIRWDNGSVWTLNPQLPVFPGASHSTDSGDNEIRS